MSTLVRRYTGFQFFFGLLFWLPIFYEYQERMGLSAAQILAIQSIYQIVFCVIEIPTGWFADRFGYLTSIKAGAATLIAANLLPIFVPDYAGFLIHFILIALSRSFISGASSAYLYEALRLEGAASEYKRVEGTARSLGLVGKVVGWAGVGMLMEWHLTLPYWLTCAAALASLAYALRLPALTKAAELDFKEKASSSATDSVFWSVVNELKLNRVLLFLMLQGIAIFTLSRVAQVTLFQPILNGKSIPLAWHGAVMSAMTLFEAAGSWRPDFARKWLSDLNAVSILTIILALCLAVIPFSNSTLTIAVLCLFSLAVGLSFPVQKQVMNDAIHNPKLRATLLSIESILDRAVSAIATLIMARYLAGNAMDSFLIHASVITVMTTIAIALGLRYYRLNPRR